VHLLAEDLRTEIDRIKEALRKLTEEVEKIRGQEKEGLVVVDDATGELRHEPKEIIAIENLMREMTGKVEEGGALMHAGYLVKNGKRIGIWVNTASMDKWIDAPLKIAPKEITRFLSPFSSEQRITILRSLFEGFLQGKTVSELVEETGFEGGQLYHHLRELERANYVETKEERGRYFISVIGHIALLTVSHMAMALPRFIKKKLGETEPN
jgi:DNA-binding transcriptional ArsR family regulator